MSDLFGEMFDLALKKKIHEVLVEIKGGWGLALDTPEYVATDNLGEAVEKLAILHIRSWMLEDAMQDAQTDTELADLKRKIDICFKVKRPRLVEAINKIVDDAISRNKSIREDSVKLYKGVQ